MRKKYIIKKLVLMGFLSLAFGIFISVAFAGIQYYKAGMNRGKQIIDTDTIKQSRQITTDGNKYTISKNGGEIKIYIGSKYINKLSFEYNSDDFINYKILVTQDNIYGVKEKKEIYDGLKKDMPRSVVNIGANVSEIEMIFENVDDDIEVWNFQIDNSLKVNPLIAIFIAATVFLISFLIILRKENATHPALAFIICSFILGICMLLMEPPYIVGWDEQIHYQRAYSMFARESTTLTKAGDFQIGEAYWLDSSAIPAQESIEERIDMIRILNNMGNEQGTIYVEKIIQPNSIGYVFQALFLKIGNMLHLPFYVVWLMGKFANILLYTVIVGIAIYIIPVAKRLLIVLGLMPLTIFQSTTYTYDITVISFIVLGSAILVKELICQDLVLRYRWRIIMIGSFIIGCLPKAVYAPLILGTLFLEREKFYSKKDQKIFRGILLIVFLGLIISIAIPMMTPDQLSDARGGNTNGIEQIGYILHQPVAYAIILFNNVLKAFQSHFMGADVLNSFAYFGIGRTSTFCTALLIGTTLTDSYSNEKRKALDTKTKIGIMVLITATIVLIWTALYVSYTEVASSSIAGVQARYYLPFLLLFYLCFHSEKIKSTFSLEKYQMCIMLSSNLLVFIQIYQVLFVSKCF